jgi:zinc transporter ZupT
LFASIIIILIHFIGKLLAEKIEKFHAELLSFGAGLMIGTFFLEIMPHISIGTNYLGKFIYIYLLIGFMTIHLFEKLVFQNAASEIELAKDVILFEEVGLATYGLVIGVIIAVFFEAYGNLAFLMLIPLFFRAFAISTSADHIVEGIQNKFITTFQFFAPIIGTLSGLFLIQNKVFLFSILSVVTGFILYIVVRDIIPIGKGGRPIYFLAGTVFTIAVTLFFERN